MSHRIIIINSQTPDQDAPTITVKVSEPEFKVSVEYRPSDSMTSSQIGNEVARIQRKVTQIIEGTPD